jgi:phosphopantothenoylcysteine decarboxylase / phosphopantothenate---cysteine ligase
VIAPGHHCSCGSSPLGAANRSDGAGKSLAVRPPRLLITAGPTHEPIDAVRFIGNRSSGRMGIALAEAAARMGWDVKLMLGPVSVADPRLDGLAVHRFRTCEDLRGLLAVHASSADMLVMAAAVADYRPRPNPAMSCGKFRRTEGPLTLELESTPDLLAEASRARRADQLFVGFALEPREDLLASARSKLSRKRIDLVVANPLETMDSDAIEAMVLGADGTRIDTPGLMPKSSFAPWLLEQLFRRLCVLRNALAVERGIQQTAA